VLKFLQLSRLQYKSYTDENTHIHVLYPDRLPESIRTHLSYVCEVRIDRWRCASKGKRVLSGPKRSVDYGISTVYNGGLFN
jgi:hypothetical protein